MLDSISEMASQNISIFMIWDAPTVPLLKSIDKMLGTFFLHQYVFKTAVMHASSIHAPIHASMCTAACKVLYVNQANKLNTYLFH